jgi:putative membrane protein
MTLDLEWLGEELRMKWLANLSVAVVALEHIGFLVLEMFYWAKPLGLKVFHTAPDFAAASATLAANQGLYNGFLAAGLLWSLVAGRRLALKLFFLACVVIAGAFGALTANMSILFVQALPGAVALILVLATARKA